MPIADKRIFDYFAYNEESAQEVDYLAFASYAFAKFEWFDKFVSQHGAEPTQAELDKWADELPDSRLDEIHDNASRVFRSAAKIYMAEKIKEAQARAVSESVLSKVRESNEKVENYVRIATSFWANLVPNIVLGILTSLIFSIVLILASLIFTKDPSPIALYKSVTPNNSSRP